MTDIRALRERVEGLEAEVERLKNRQVFNPAKLGPGLPEAASRPGRGPGRVPEPEDEGPVGFWSALGQGFLFVGKVIWGMMVAFADWIEKATRPREEAEPAKGSDDAEADKPDSGKAARAGGKKGGDRGEVWFGVSTDLFRKG